MNAVVATPVVDTVTPEKLRALVEDAITAAWGEDHVAWASLDDTSGQLVQAAVDLMGIAATARVQQADAHNGGW